MSNKVWDKISYAQSEKLNEKDTSLSGPKWWEIKIAELTSKIEQLENKISEMKAHK